MKNGVFIEEKLGPLGPFIHLTSQKELGEVDERLVLQFVDPVQTISGFLIGVCDP